MAPFLPGAKAKFNQRPTGDLRHDDPTELCLPDGHPRGALAPYAQQIVQTPHEIVMLYKYMHFFRVIPIGKPLPADVEPTFMGNAVASWDGDTSGRYGRVFAYGRSPQATAGTAMRCTRSNASGISTRRPFRTKHPKIFTCPWSQTFEMKLYPIWPLLEQVCEQNNRNNRCQGP